MLATLVPSGGRRGGLLREPCERSGLGRSFSRSTRSSRGGETGSCEGGQVTRPGGSGREEGTVFSRGRPGLPGQPRHPRTRLWPWGSSGLAGAGRRHALAGRPRRGRRRREKGGNDRQISGQGRKSVRNAGLLRGVIRAGNNMPGREAGHVRAGRSGQPLLVGLQRRVGLGRPVEVGLDTGRYKVVSLPGSLPFRALRGL